MRPRVSPVNATLVSIAFGWLLLFAHGGLGAPFTGDDLMNLHGHVARGLAGLAVDNLRYWSTAYRPLGGLFYVAIHRGLGFHPLPFRVACFGLLALNLGLLWRFTLRLSGRREVAFLALLLASYHARFVDLYYSTGTVYDLLCYSCYLTAFTLYLGARSQGKILSAGRLGLIAFLYVCALNAKEMAISLPALLFAYEMVYRGRDAIDRGPRWLWREGRGVVLTGLLTVPYIVGKLSGPGSLVENPAYRLTVSPARYLHAFHLYLNPLLYQDHVFRDSNTVQLVLAMLALALWRRNRALLFAWCFLLVSLLPVAFIAHYSGFFLYLPMAGWALYAAELLAMARRFLIGRLRAERLNLASAIALPILLALFLAPRHVREGAMTLRAFQNAQPPARKLAGELMALHPTLPRGARVLFLDDPAPGQEYFLLFLLRLLYGDMSIAVDKAPAGQARYDAVFAFRDGRLADAAVP